MLAINTRIGKFTIDLSLPIMDVSKINSTVVEKTLAVESDKAPILMFVLVRIKLREKSIIP